MFALRFDVVLAAGFILSTWVPLISTQIGSVAAKSFFIAWLLCTWGRHFATCVRFRYGVSVLVSFMAFASVYLIYVLYTDRPDSLFHGVAMVTWKGYIWTFCFWMVLHYYLARGDLSALKQLAVFFVVGVFVTAILTLWGIGRFGETVSRAMVAVTKDSDRDALRDAIDASHMGVASFAHIYGMMLMIPPLLYSIKYVPRRVNMACLLMAFVLAICVYKASFLTAVFAMIFGAIVVFSMRQRAVPPTIIWAGGLLLVTIIFIFASHIVMPLLDSAETMGWIQGNEVYLSKIEDFRDYFSTRDTDTLSRFQRIQWSWDLFLKRPLFGHGFLDVGMGGHSEIFDQLGRFGLVGSIPLVIFLYWLNKYLDTHVFETHLILKRMKKTVVLPFIFVAVFNPISHGSAWSVFLFFVPAFAFFYMPRYTGKKPEGSMRSSVRRLPLQAV